MDFNQCACSGKSLGRLLQPTIMTVLAGEPLHGYRILQRLGEMEMFRGHPPDATGVYRFLKSMEKDGLVTSTWDLADSGPARRRYELTADGRACLAQWTETLEAYRQAVTEVLAALRAAR
jgi:PadR family transcriptional regulator PadR